LSILPIRQLPDLILKQKAKKVRRIDSSINRLIADMLETMYAASGVGLAANQIGVLQRVIVIHLPEDELPIVYINPVITSREGEREVEEGCLSIPGYRGFIMRAVQVKSKGQNQEGKIVKITADGLLSQAIEHEIDHLNGILYVDHLTNHNKLEKLPPDNGSMDSMLTTR